MLHREVRVLVTLEPSTPPAPPPAPGAARLAPDADPIGSPHRNLRDLSLLLPPTQALKTHLTHSLVNQSPAHPVPHSLGAHLRTTTLHELQTHARSRFTYSPSVTFLSAPDCSSSMAIACRWAGALGYPRRSGCSLGAIKCRRNELSVANVKPKRIPTPISTICGSTSRASTRLRATR